MKHGSAEPAMTVSDYIIIGFSVNSAINMTRFETLTESKNRYVFTNVLNLENAEKSLYTIIMDLDGNFLAEDVQIPEYLDKIEKREASVDSKRVVVQLAEINAKKVTKYAGIKVSDTRQKKKIAHEELPVKRR